MKEVLTVLIEFITKYWLEVVFSLICGGAAFVIKHHIKLIIEDRKRHEKDLIDAMTNKLDEQKVNMEKQITACHGKLLDTIQTYDEKSRAEDKILHEEVDVIRDGMLSIQGRAFKDQCRYLLRPDHVITLNEYESILHEHSVYNRLGGNHEGDGLFSSVQAKYQNSLGT